eukprot:350136-Chlamydomonas_euryale.AAC.23
MQTAWIARLRTGGAPRRRESRRDLAPAAQPSDPSAQALDMLCDLHAPAGRSDELKVHLRGEGERKRKKFPPHRRLTAEVVMYSVRPCARVLPVLLARARPATALPPAASPSRCMCMILTYEGQGGGEARRRSWPDACVHRLPPSPHKSRLLFGGQARAAARRAAPECRGQAGDSGACDIPARRHVAPHQPLPRAPVSAAVHIVATASAWRDACLAFARSSAGGTERCTSSSLPLGTQLGWWPHVSAFGNGSRKR